MTAIDHKTEAVVLLTDANNYPPGSVLRDAFVVEAYVQATLALVEQQRIGNRIALNALVAEEQRHYREHGSRVNLTGPEGVFVNEYDEARPSYAIPRLADDIREGLTLS